MRRLSLGIAGLMLALGCTADDKPDDAVPSPTTSTTAAASMSCAVADPDDPGEVIVFLEQDIDEAERAAIASVIEADSRAQSYRYLDEEDSMAEFERLFAESEEMLERAREHPENLPTSFRVVPAAEDRAAIEAMADDLDALPGVLRANSSAGGC